MSRSSFLSSGPQKRMVQLDALRGLAALAVVVHHCFDGKLPNWLGLGSYGVTLFFVLSGFLITGILLKDRARMAAGNVYWREALWNFYVRRSLRIFPLAYGAIAIAAMLELPRVRENLLWFLGYAINFKLVIEGHPIGVPGPWSMALVHFWTLAVEEQFYLVWPALILLTPHRYLLATISVAILITPLSDFVIALTGHPMNPAFVLPNFHLDALGAGALLALLASRDDPDARQRLRGILDKIVLVALPLFVLCKAAMAWIPGSPDLGSLSNYAIDGIFLWLIGRASVGFRGAAKVLLEWRPLVYLGTISYGIYVYHGMIIDWGYKHTGVTRGVHHLMFGWGGRYQRFVAVFVLTVLAASVSWWFFEKPINDLKRFFSDEQDPKDHPTAS